VLYEAQYLVVAAGLYGVPNFPTGVPGFGSFKGPAFHTSRWDHSVDLKASAVLAMYRPCCLCSHPGERTHVTRSRSGG
jgi:hypothetical protein